MNSYGDSIQVQEKRKNTMYLLGSKFPFSTGNTERTSAVESEPSPPAKDLVLHTAVYCTHEHFILPVVLF